MPGKDLSALGWLLWKSLWWKTNSVFKKSLHKFFSNLKWKELYWVPWKWYIVLQSRLCTETVNKSIGTAFSGHIWAYLRMMSLDLKHFMLSHCSWGADQNPCHAPLSNLISAPPLSPVLQPEIKPFSSKHPPVGTSPLPGVLWAVLFVMGPLSRGWQSPLCLAGQARESCNPTKPSCGRFSGRICSQGDTTFREPFC